MGVFPGIENIIANDMIHRSLGNQGVHQMFGAGFMNKSGQTADCTRMSSPYYVMVYVLRGSGHYLDDRGQPYVVRAGDVFQRFPGRVHTTTIDPESGWRECFIVLGQEFYRNCRNLRMLYHDTPVVGIGVDSGLINRIWRFKEEFKAAGEEELPALVCEVLSLAVELHRRMGLASGRELDNRMVTEICELLSRDFHHHPNLPEICREYGCGYENFRKRFREQIGLSPGQYRIRRRLDAACELLLEHRHSINEIAWLLGYSSPFEFSAQFKKFIGVSPVHYRGGGI